MKFKPGDLYEEVIPYGNDVYIMIILGFQPRDASKFFVFWSGIPQKFEINIDRFSIDCENRRFRKLADA